MEVTYTRIANPTQVGVNFTLQLPASEIPGIRAQYGDKLFFIQIVKDELLYHKADGTTVHNIDRPDTAQFELIRERMIDDGWAIDQTIYERLRGGSVQLCNIDPRYVAKRCDPYAEIKKVKGQWNNYLTENGGKWEPAEIRFGDEPSSCIGANGYMTGSTSFHLALFLERDRKLKFNQVVASWGYEVEWNGKVHAVSFKYRDYDIKASVKEEGTVASSPYREIDSSVTRSSVEALFASCARKWNDFVKGCVSSQVANDIQKKKNEFSSNSFKYYLIDTH